MLLIVFLISLEIFFAYLFFKTSTMVSDEFSAYFMVFSVFLGLAYTLKEGKHIKITLITSRIKNKKSGKGTGSSCFYPGICNLHICTLLFYHDGL